MRFPHTPRRKAKQTVRAGRRAWHPWCLLIFGMLAIRYILCPIDFSETSRHALKHAVAVAGWYGSTIVALHVRAPALQTFPEVAIVPPAPQPADTQLREWLAPATAADIATELVVAEGIPTGEILDRAASLPADLLVMGTHGLSGFEHLLLGSVTEKVLRKAMCPVMTVPPPAAAVSTLPYKRLLCPVDFSESSLAAVQFAVSLAQEADAHLTLLHVFEWPTDDAMKMHAEDVLCEFCREREARTRERLDSLIRQDVRNWCTPEVQVRNGKPHQEIVRRAEAEHDDLIVMGVHARGPLARWWLGSTTNQVVRQAACPVLTLRT